METINNLASAASNAIFGKEEDKTAANSQSEGITTTTSGPNTTGANTTNSTMQGNNNIIGGTTGSSHTGYSGQEPVSGQLGNTRAGEPYDKGNVGK